MNMPMACATRVARCWSRRTMDVCGVPAPPVVLQYQSRIRMDNEHGLGQVSRAGTFQRAVTVSKPIPWKPKPEHTEETLAILREREEIRKAEEAELERIRLEEEAAEAKALASFAGLDLEDEDEVRAKKARKAEHVIVRKPPAPKEVVDDVDSEPEEDWDDKVFHTDLVNGLPNEFPFNLAFGTPINVRFPDYHDTLYPARALWYRKAKLTSLDYAVETPGWALEVHW